MREEIEKALSKLRIEGRETRKRMAVSFSIFSIVVALLFFLYFYSQPSMHALGNQRRAKRRIKG